MGRGNWMIAVAASLDTGLTRASIDAMGGMRARVISFRSRTSRLDFDTPLSSIATLPQSPLPSRPHSWLTSTNPPHFTLATLHFLFSPLFLSLPFSSLSAAFLPLLSPILYMPIICPCSCYIGLYYSISRYKGFATRDDIMPIQLPRMTQ